MGQIGGVRHLIDKDLKRLVLEFDLVDSDETKYQNQTEELSKPIVR